MKSREKKFLSKVIKTVTLPVLMSVLFVGTSILDAADSLRASMFVILTSSSILSMVLFLLGEGGIHYSAIVLID